MFFLTAHSVMRVAPAARVTCRSVAEMVRELHWTDAEEFAKYCMHCVQWLRYAQQCRWLPRSEAEKRFIQIVHQSRRRKVRLLGRHTTVLQTAERRGSGSTDLKSSKSQEIAFYLDDMNNRERTIRAFIGVVKFFIDERQDCLVKPKVHARRISQDPLENYNSKQRGKLGANKHPDLAQPLQSNVNMHLQSKLALRGSKRRNTRGRRQ